MLWLLPGAPTVRREAEAAPTPGALRGVLQTQCAFPHDAERAAPHSRPRVQTGARDHEAHTRGAQRPRVGGLPLPGPDRVSGCTRCLSAGEPLSCLR